MTARYFTRSGSGHSRRGAAAREHGAMAWSRLPQPLRRGLTSKQAEHLRISQEWHHSGKYATEVVVYLPEAVEAFWARLDTDGVSVAQVLAHRPNYVREETGAERALTQALHGAQEDAERVRQAWEDSRESD